MKLRLSEEEQYPCYTAHPLDPADGEPAWETIVEVDDATAARWLRVQAEGDAVNAEIAQVYFDWCNSHPNRWEGIP